MEEGALFELATPRRASDCWAARRCARRLGGAYWWWDPAPLNSLIASKVSTLSSPDASMTARPPVVSSRDTEEDDWGAYTCRTPAVTNAAMLPRFQQLCERYGALPTYLVNWPIVSSDSARDIVSSLAAGGNAEVGTHIHPWNTPPVLEQPGPRESMLCNLPDDLIASKLANLHRAIEARFRLSPRAFRAGRWGFSRAVAEVLETLHYRVDSSVSPHVDWSPDHGPDYRNAPTTPYGFRASAPLQPDPAGSLLEVPATIGYLGGNPRSGRRLREWAFRPLPRRLRMVGVLDRLRLASLRWLSPEVATAREMIRLSTVLAAAGATHLNFTFHSTTLVPGLTPFVRTAKDAADFVARIETFLDFARGAGYHFARLGDAPVELT